MNFSNRLKELRNDGKLTQKQVAIALEISPTCYAGYEQGYRFPDIPTIGKLCNFFQVSADYLLGRSDDFGNVAVQSSAPALTEEEQEILNLFRSMTHSQQIRFTAYGEGMLENTIKKKA